MPCFLNGVLEVAGPIAMHCLLNMFAVSKYTCIFVNRGCLVSGSHVAEMGYR